MIRKPTFSNRAALVCGVFCLGVAGAGNAQGTVDVSSDSRPARPKAKTEEPPLRPAANTDVQKLLGEAQDLQGRHRYFDALAKLDQAEKLTPEDPNIFNTRGAIYLVPAVRDFDKAQEQFEKAQVLAPTALAPKFNLAELFFVKQKFAESEAGFAALLKDFPKLQIGVRHLVVFKVLISQAEQGKIDAANATLKTHFTFMDDTPAYYFAKASIAFAQKKEDDAKEWIEKAKVIFKPVDNSPYLDSLMETRHIPNIMMSPVNVK
ncbi:MAG: hypothetical protein K1X78_20490 [Verrucomicrobiaceae bacterium]|nr:hypothetical protein [Verrucomicrobiaceae bacterium]